MSKAVDCRPVIGIVGGVGAGKTTVAAEFARLGCATVDADKIGHAVLEEPSVKRALRCRWGRAIIDDGGRVNRKALAAAVFNDPGQVAELNRILHPRIRLRMEQEIARAHERQDVPAIVLDAALLIEAGWRDLCTHVIFVDCPPQVRLRRVEQRRGWSEAVWRSRENFQNSLDKKAEVSDYTVVNSSSVSYLVVQIRKLFDEIVRASDRPGRTCD